MRPRCAVEAFSPEVKLESTTSVSPWRAGGDRGKTLRVLSALSYARVVELKSRNGRTSIDDVRCCRGRATCAILSGAS